MKKNIFFLNILCWLLFFSTDIFPQSQNTTQGKDFWLSFGKNYDDSSPVYQIRIVASKNTRAYFTFTESNTTDFVDILAGEVLTRSLDYLEMDAVCSNISGVSSKSLHITTDELVSVFAINLMIHTTDATNILPTNTLGVDYYHISYSPLLHDTYSLDGYTVIAVEDNTTISEDGVIQVTIDKGEVYSSYFALDGTGKHITSTKPIACFTTNSCVNVPVNEVACDCLFQQMAPVNVWGNNFLVPVTTRGVERVRVVASQNNTLVQQTGATLITNPGKGSYLLDAGEFVELEVYLANDGCYINSDKPVAVCSYLTGISHPLALYYMGDPSLSWVPPIEQTVASVTIAPFIADGSSVLEEHHALIVTATATKNQTIVTIGTGSPQPLFNGAWYDNLTSGYSFYTFPMDVDDVYYFDNSNGLTILGYGLGACESYYYLAAASSRSLDAAFYVNEKHFEDINGQIYCDTIYNFKAVIQYAMSATPGYLKWYINGVEEISNRDMLTWQKKLPPGTYQIDMVVIDLYGDPHTLTTTFTVATPPAPPVISGNLILCPPTYSTVLTASGSGASYKWFKDGVLILGASTNTCTASAIGYYSALLSDGSCESDTSAQVFVNTGICLFADADFAITAVNKPVSIPVLSNDQTGTCTVSTVSLAMTTPPKNGSASVSYGTIIYTPDHNYIGLDSLFYTISCSGFGTSSAKVTIFTYPNTRQLCFGETSVITLGVHLHGATVAWFNNITPVSTITVTNLMTKISYPYIAQVTFPAYTGSVVVSDASAGYDVDITPELMYWSKTATNNNWNDPNNWVTASGAALDAVPGTCTTVHIPGDALNYPSLDIDNTPRGIYGNPVCDSIIYHFGGEVAKPHLLTYNQAFVQYNFGYYNGNTYKDDGDVFSAQPMERGRWYALSAPLKNIASGDYSFGGKPDVWRQGFKRINVGEDLAGVWESPDNSNALEIGNDMAYGISVWVAKVESGKIGSDVLYQDSLNKVKGVIEMPYFENQALSILHRTHEYLTNKSRFYYYYYQLPNQDIEYAVYDEIVRGSEAYRFVFDNDLSLHPITGDVAFQMTLPANKELMIGNPFVSTMDFDAFYRMNSNKINPFYRLYNGTGWDVYSYGTGGSGMTKNIAPLEAFFVQTVVSTDPVDLYFAPDSVSITDPSTKLRSSKKAPRNFPNALYINLSSYEGYSWSTIALDPTGKKRNIPCLFNIDPRYEGVPQIYIDDLGVKNSVQFVPPADIKEIKLGIQVQGRARFTLRFENTENIQVESLTLVDKELGVRINLFDENTYSFDNLMGGFENRFSVMIGKPLVPTIINENVSAKETRIYSAGSVLNVISEQEISSIRVTNALGQKMWSETQIGKRQFNKQLNMAPGVYVVQVQLVNGSVVTEKVMF